jgi:hypothetical protein
MAALVFDDSGLLQSALIIFAFDDRGHSDPWLSSCAAPAASVIAGSTNLASLVHHL